MVERIHRQLKGALRCHGEAWYDALPLVLLGLRSAWKEDLQTTPAELTYGEPIRLPGEFLIPSNQQAAAPELVRNLREHFRRIAPTPAARHGTRSTFIFKDLATCTHVFVRDDHSGGLGNYTNPPISIDRLKPAYVLPEDMDQVQGQPPPPDVPEEPQQQQNQPQPSTANRTQRRRRRVNFANRPAIHVYTV
ncbi:uncharacterized protein LOC107041715 [Diachasma alloeum]|uniref:uncharacterized protein LOC107041715 n=1 Tax=Diachasma alloeum TaxID=454923 RepID=UPI0007383E61|nr:uncharacterized protein LOC107041715 [Diachasma alloeum]